MHDPLTFETRLTSALSGLADLAPVIDEVQVVNVVTEARRSWTARLFGAPGSMTHGRTSPRLAYLLIVTALLIAALVASLVIGSLQNTFAARNGNFVFSAQGDWRGGYYNVIGADGTGVGRIQGLCPYYSSDGSAIAYMAGDESHLVVAAPNGTITREFEEITHQGLHRPESIALSPDGQHVAYFTDGQLWIYPVDGAPARAVADGTEMPSYPTWSPDGRRIAFKAQQLSASGDVAYTSDLYVVDLDDGELRLISTRAAAFDFGTAWSTDGQYLAYVGVPEGAPELAEGEPATDIFVVRAEGTSEQNLTNSTASERQVAWAPDGSRLAYISDLEGISRLISLRMSAGSPAGSSTTGPETGSFVWAPDATQLMWIEAIRRGSRAWTSTFYVVDGDFNLPSSAIYSVDGMLLCDPSWQRLDPEE